METEMNEIVKPCPFCGSSPPDPDDLMDVCYPNGWFWKIDEDGDRDYFTHGEMREKGLAWDGREYSIGCMEWYGGCGAEMTADTYEGAIEKWNRRSEPKPFHTF